MNFNKYKEVVMKIFVAILKNNFKSLLAERVDFIVPPLVNIIWVGVMYFLWTHIFAGGLKDVGGFSQSEMVRYYLVMFFLALLMFIHVAPDITRHIKRGLINQHLLKPYSTLSVIYNFGLTKFLFNLLVALGCLALILVIQPSIISMSGFYFLFFIPVVLLALFLFMSMGLVIGLVAFWTTETVFLQIFNNLLITFFGGIFFPLSLLKGSLATIANILPYKYIVFFPAQVILGKISYIDIARGIGLQLSWIIILLLVILWVWKKGLKKYEAFGG